MTTPISRPTIVRRPWIEYLKENRERWIREAGKSNQLIIRFLFFNLLSFFSEEEKRRKELKVIEEEP